MPGYVARVARRLRSMGAAIVHLNQHEYRSGRHVAVATWLAGVPIVSTVHLLPGTRLRPDPGQRLMNRIVARTIAVSPAISARLVSELAVDPRRVRVILNGIEIDAGNGPADSEVRELAGNRRIVLGVGRLTEQKGFGDLVEAACALPDAAIVLVGDGPLRPDLERWAELLGVADRVFFLGHRANVRALLAAADVVAVPSREEGLPLSLLEAMAAGTPIVAADIPGIALAIGNGTSGLLVPPGDVPALAAALRRLLDDPGLGGALAAEARRIVGDRFAAPRMVSAVVDEYESLAPRASG
jgi:glycosyltransferase involved in cell wall biosynthesis